MRADALADETATFGITAEMGRQYKAMQEGLLEKIGALEAHIGRLKGELGEEAGATSSSVSAHTPSLPGGDVQNGDVVDGGGERCQCKRLGRD